MKKYSLKTPRFTEDLKAFRTWLQTLNYSPSTVYNSPNYTNEFLYFLEQKKQFDYSKISTEFMEQYFFYLQSRSKENQDGSLSVGSLKKHQSSINYFVRFLNTNNDSIPPFSFPYFENIQKEITVLSEQEVQLLFAHCGKDLIGKRNKAMLALFYSCGLRKSEGINLNIEDLDFRNSLLFVRKSKTHHQRFVPISKGAKQHLEDYFYNAREYILPSDSIENSFLITERGTRFSIALAPYLLGRILAKINNKNLTQKTTLHVLRHSIASHLLKRGMSLENIALFLGHKSLDSTQIYTHIL